VIFKKLTGYSQVQRWCLLATYYRGLSQSLHYNNNNYPSISDQLLSAEHRNSPCAHKYTKCSVLCDVTLRLCITTSRRLRTINLSQNICNRLSSHVVSYHKRKAISDTQLRKYTNIQNSFHFKMCI